MGPHAAVWDLPCPPAGMVDLRDDEVVGQQESTRREHSEPACPQRVESRVGHM